MWSEIILVHAWKVPRVAPLGCPVKLNPIIGGSGMSNQRYSPEFRDEAIRQVADRGYSVPEVSERLDVSTHSLYRWIKAVPDILSSTTVLDYTQRGDRHQAVCVNSKQVIGL
jgi:hypothetical protein